MGRRPFAGRPGGRLENDIYSITSYSISETGKVRQINEDAVLETGGMFAVADGMGGHQAGEVASSLALSVVGQYIEDNLGLISGEKLVEKAAAAANAAVYAKASSSARFKQMGTTLTLMYRESDTVYISHVGDSRAYLFREGRLKRITRDHSLVATLVEEGEITEEQARTHPQRNIILKALGLEPQVETDVFAVRIQPGDVFVLATDGLTGLVEDEYVTGVLSSPGSPETWAGRLVDAALEAGGTDNVSVIVVSIQESPTVVPVKGARPIVEASDSPQRASDLSPANGKDRKRLRKRLIIGVSVLLVLALAFGIGFYSYNRTFWVGVKGGKITLFKGFPLWGLWMVEEQSDTDSRFLPEAVRHKVEGKLETESKRNARKTLESLERQAMRNSSIVPDVQGKKYKEAREALEAAGLRAHPVLVSRNGIEAHLVIEQDPVPGTRVGKGSTVNLRVVMAGESREV